MNYSQALKYLAETCWFGKHPTLKNIRRIMKQVSDPHKKVPVIQVTGTNGKSSVVWAVSQILTDHSLKSASFTSPHLNSYTERFLINGKHISEEDFCSCLVQVKKAISRIHKEESDKTEFTHFEILTAMAYLYFAIQKVDVAVFEVGMGGRWDATSVCSPTVSVITNIELDHTERLGKTKKAIAGEKAFIIKRGSTAIIGDITGDALEQILKRAEQMNVQALQLGKDMFLSRIRSGASSLHEKNADRAYMKTQNIFSYRSFNSKFKDLACDLLGDHQKKNMTLAISAAGVFLSSRNMVINEQQLRTALTNVTSPGRMDVVSDEGPLMMLDGAHNEAGVINLLKEIRKYLIFDKLIVVAAILEDKDIKAMTGALWKGADILILTKNYSYRCADPQIIANDIYASGEEHDVIASQKLIIEPDLKIAIKKSRKVALSDDLILITGSLYTVGHARYVLGLGPLEN